MSKMINALGEVAEGNEESLDAVVGVGRRRIPRLRSRDDFRRFRIRDEAQFRGRQEPQPQARVAPGATSAASRHVVIRISDRDGARQPRVVIFDGRMTQEQINRLQRSIQQNRTTSPDHRLLAYSEEFAAGGAYRSSPMYRVKPQFAVNLRRLYSRRTNQEPFVRARMGIRGTPETEATAEPKEIIAE